MKAELQLPNCASPELRLARIAPREYAALFASLKKANLQRHSFFLQSCGSAVRCPFRFAQEDLFDVCNFDSLKRANLWIRNDENIISNSYFKDREKTITTDCIVNILTGKWSL